MMKLEINHRGNGVCPSCALDGRCPIQKSLKNTVSEIYSPHTAEMESVIYVCPDFTEK